MSEEIKEILDKLNKTADNPLFVICSSQKELDKIPKYTANFLSVNDRQAKLLLNYITNLQQKVEEKNKEIDRLNKEYERIYNENCKLRENHNINDITLLDENNRLKNIIDELEKWCNECIDNHIIARENGVTTISDTFFEIVLDKLKELKENNKDV